MENLDKLFQLYESGNLPLVLQLCQAEGITKKVFIKMLFDKYLDRTYNRVQSFYYTNTNNKHDDFTTFRFCIYYYITSDEYSFWYVINDFHSNQVRDRLDKILDKFLEIIENE